MNGPTWSGTNNDPVGRHCRSCAFLILQYRLVGCGTDIWEPLQCLDEPVDPSRSRRLGPCADNSSRLSQPYQACTYLIYLPYVLRYSDNVLQYASGMCLIYILYIVSMHVHY